MQLIIKFICAGGCAEKTDACIDIIDDEVNLVRLRFERIPDGWGYTRAGLFCKRCLKQYAESFLNEKKDNCICGPHHGDLFYIDRSVEGDPLIHKACGKRYQP